MKPFNLADAKAGHPVRLTDGRTVTVWEWEYPIRGVGAVVIGKYVDDVFPKIGRWKSNGDTVRGASGTFEHPQLTMAPVGKLNGRDVYPGDIINGKSVPHDKPFNPDEWRPVVETRMTQQELNASAKYGMGSVFDVANAALKHAVDNGYLVVPDNDREMRIAGHFYNMGHDDSMRGYLRYQRATLREELAKVE